MRRTKLKRQDIRRPVHGWRRTGHRALIEVLECRQLLAGNIYVDLNSPGPTHDGSSWANAYADLQEALGAAVSGDQILVADGTYKPTATADRTISFQLKNGVELDGGYAGYGAANPDARDVATYKTVLSGDIGTAGNTSDNSYHVVVGSGTDGTAILDGFRMSDGNANGSDLNGGGMYNVSGSPTISNCTFSGNSAEDPYGNGGYGGGGMYNHSSSPTLTNCTFSGNSASYDGGGIYNGFDSSPTLIGCTFSGNAAGNYGGGICDNSSSPTLTNCTFSGNSASYDGGGMYNCFDSSPTLTDCAFSKNSATESGGGMYNYFDSSPTLTNCAFSKNSATESGGGMYNNSSSSKLTNCAFSGNSANYDGGGIYNSSASPKLTNCTFSGNSATGTDGSGGGMCNHSSSPTLTNCTFSGNSASYDGGSGGGMFNFSSSSPKLSNCTFSGNSASMIGGGMFNGSSSSPILNNCTFSRNSATESGGAMSNGSSSSPILSNCTFSGNTAGGTYNGHGGGMYNEGSSPTLINCTFSGNSTTDPGGHNGGSGGAMYNALSSSPTLTNCTFSGNSADSGGVVSNYRSSSPKLSNCIVWGNTAAHGPQIYQAESTITIIYSDIQGGWAGTGNINTVPLFLGNPSPGPDGKWGTADDDYGDLRLRSSSPCVNAGSNAAVPAGVTTDLAGNPRIVHSIVDMGAYESSWATPTNISGVSLSGTAQVLASGLLTATRSYKASRAVVSPDFRIEYRLSTNTIWGDRDDIIITQYETINQASGKSIGTHSGTFSLTVPTSVKAASYYLLAKLDSTSQVIESSKTDNVIVGSRINIIPPANDSFAYHPTITGLSAGISGANANATKEAGEPAHAGYAGGHSVWWTWTAPDSGRVVIDSTGSSFKTLLGVYMGTKVSALIAIASNKGLGSSVAFNAIKGRAYQIAVDGYLGAVGSIKLNVKLTAGVLHEKQAAIAPTAGWRELSGGYQGKVLYTGAGTGANVATWTFSNLSAGTYSVSATWLNMVAAATNAPFKIYDGTKFLGTVLVNQKLGPKGTTFDGVVWQALKSFKITSGSLVITLSNYANGYVVADGVRIERTAAAAQKVVAPALAAAAAPKRALLPTSAAQWPFATVNIASVFGGPKDDIFI